jgi:hypothetical protein
MRAIIHSESEVIIMNCLKCPNYWNTNIDELMCEFCPYSGKHKEKESEDNG